MIGQFVAIGKRALQLYFEYELRFTANPVIDVLNSITAKDYTWSLMRKISEKFEIMLILKHVKLYPKP